MPMATGSGADPPQHEPPPASSTVTAAGVSAGSVPQEVPQPSAAAPGSWSSVIRLVEQTPVSGRSSSTASAAARSPARAATMERTCSYPVAIRKVGARP